MSNARDKANIPVLNFQSKGIDDNADATAITIDSSERVGIGNASPSYNLDVVSSGSDTASFKGRKVRIDGSAAANSPQLNLSLDGTDGGQIILNRVSNNLQCSVVGSNDIEFLTNSTERMRIDSSGNVGIGTSSPSAMLELFKAGTTQIKNAYSSTKYSLFGRTGGNYYWSSYEGGGNLIFSTSASDNATTERMRIDSSGNVGIGIQAFSNSYANTLFIESSSNTGLTIASGTSSYSSIYFANSTDNDKARIEVVHSDNSMRFTNNASERMRIDSSGNLLIGKSSTSDTVIGHQFNSGGGLTTIMDTNKHHIFNKQTEDGTIIFFRQANSTEGSISVSGATVSYNGFTGTHWSRLTDNSKPTILKGTVLETLDEMCDWYNLEFDVTIITGEDEDGNDITGTYTEKIPHVLLDSQSNGDTVTYNHEGTDYQATIVKEADIKHMKSKVSDTADAKNVYGVFVAYDEDGEGYNDFYVASVGSFVVRIKANETIAKGDLLQSNGDGTAKVQTDDAVRSSSFAKVLSTTIIETYEDGSYLVPCSLMC
jgi:hypothetical protein